MARGGELRSARVTPLLLSIVMAFPLDLTMWRVYSAEQSLPEGEKFESLDDAQTYLWWVLSTRWWKFTFPDAPHITLELGGDGDIENRASYARSVTDTRSVISLHPNMMNAIVLLHEVAHCVAPRSYGDIRKINQGKVVLNRHHPHGDMFRAAFCALAERYKIGVDPEELRRAYAHFELDVPDLDALQVARTHSVEAELANTQMWERHNREWATDEKYARHREKIAELEAEREESGESTEIRIPTTLWGDWIWLTRGHFRPKVSQKRLADEVTPIVKCSVRDVARLERLKDPPKTLRDIQICLSFVAAMGLDPVWAETHKQLAPGETTLTLEKLDRIAADWVADVRHLNALLKTRPPRWEAQGDR